MRIIKTESTRTQQFVLDADYAIAISKLRRMNITLTPEIWEEFTAQSARNADSTLECLEPLLSASPTIASVMMKRRTNYVYY